MKWGGEPKKVGALVVLCLVALWALWPSSSPDSPDRPVTRAAARPAADNVIPSGPVSTAPATPARRPNQTRQVVAEARPSLRKPAPGPNAPNPMDIDPTILTDLLARVQSVPLAKASRNVFAFGAAPPVEVAAVKPPPKPGPKVPTIIPQPFQPAGSNVAVVRPAPPPPPIPLRFYGFTARQGSKRAFFLDGEDILVGNEGDVLKSRYRIVRIGINSVVMEDQQFHQQQTLPLLEDQQS